MLGEKMREALNKQINAELYSAYLYLSMSAQFGADNLKGMANWMRVQAQEEMVHAMKFYTFILDRGGKVHLLPLEAPPAKWASPRAAFEDAYKHECKVSSLIHALVDLANAEKDHATHAFLQWFITEQVEEEASALEVAEKLKLAGDHPESLFMIDKELGLRIFTPPTPAP